ncbi:MAG: anthranilate synthase component I [Candidatus Puniceispirillum sp.]|nr:anthranilate synthase component I [Candidatus Puniceispirillum sp.]
MTLAAFEQLVGQGFNRIPVSRSILADIETPLSTYNKLARGQRSFLFESVQGGERWGRYSIIGLPAKRWLAVSGSILTVYDDDDPVEVIETEDPLSQFDLIRSRYHSAPKADLPVFHGGWVGYFSYDTVRYVESRLAQSAPPDDMALPDLSLMLSEEVVVFDNLAGALTLIINADVSQPNAFEDAIARLDYLEAQLSSVAAPLEPVSLSVSNTREIEQSAQFATDQSTFEGWVGRIKEYILAGDVMQVVPSQRMTLPFNKAPLTLYRALRNLNPSPYLYFVDLGEVQIVGSSPEILVRLEKGEVTVRPIAGTRKRGSNAEEDAALAQELLSDQKEIAEHLMLIDLGRNDVGQIAEPGSVSLTENMVVERYSHVMHIVSNVSAKVREDVGPMDALRATLPAGTLSGAPKVRAMEIIDELETVKRGIYGGAVGYVSWSGEMDTAIAIRTAVIKDKQLRIQAGAGVVADSVPSAEWEETLNKARAMLRAVAMCEG